MIRAKIFQSGNSQAIRIPKEVQTNQKEFYVRKLGEGYVFFPTDDPWFPLRESLGMFPDDFMEERMQPSWDRLSEREIL